MENQLNSDHYIQILTWANHLTEPAIRQAITHLDLPRGSRGLDAASGIGYNTRLLAEAIAPGGHITGIDISGEHIAYAQKSLHANGQLNNITFSKGDLKNLKFDDNHFDWVWAKDALLIGPAEIGCPSDDPKSLVDELVRVVKPGGTVAILFWSSQKLLPGYPLLEARLNATAAANIPATESMNPEYHSLRALGWLRKAGLTNTGVSHFMAAVQAPLDEQDHHALSACFRLLWGMSEQEVSHEDWDLFNRLCSPQSRQSILNQPDYYAFITYSLFYGKVEEAEQKVLFS
ncbi:MAG: class I SAM-dependent methyltransferase [bacterium]|nr:class I SAM-dependent methyltransferase [bacterium]